MKKKLLSTILCLVLALLMTCSSAESLLSPVETAEPAATAVPGIPDASEIPLVDRADWELAIRNGSREGPYIAITVDDCFDRTYVRQIFDLCVSYGICVTFFPLGSQLEKEDAALWQEISASPYAEIGTHTMQHLSWKKLTKREIDSSLTAFQNRLDGVLGYRYQVQSLRPPYGHYKSSKMTTNQVRQLIAAHGFRYIILWDVSQTDASKAIKSVKNGSILLYHTKAKDYKCLQKLIPKLLEKGFVPVTVSMLLGFG